MKDSFPIYVGQLCEDGFAVNFDTKNVLIQKLKHVIIVYIDATTGIYLIYVDDPQPLTSKDNHFTLALSTPFPILSNI